MTSRERILAMLDGQPVDRLPAMPITMQIAARRIGVPYRRYATEAALLAEGQLRVAADFGIDHVSVISDPACEAADCGAAVVFNENQPPALDENNALLQDKAKLATLRVPNPTAGRMGNRLRVLEIYRERNRQGKLVEGWIEGPCAEGADLRGINALMLDFYDDPDFVRDLFAFCNRMELAFAKEQIARGAELIGVGDAAASLVGPEIYREFVWPFEKELVDGLHALGARVRLHICGNTTPILTDIGRLGCDLVDLDFMVPIDAARKAMGDRQVLLGNMDPVRVLQNGTPAQVRATVAECHRLAGSRYIIGAGCEVPPDTPHENLRALVNYSLEATV
ncbi:MAG: uroporphyrinogen decarboxylase family protein [Verrucomicrobiae bacterium]|nr:uroporphyrinogen decarboxylase family protein [Verrucomicrobiae bacterium]